MTPTAGRAIGGILGCFVAAIAAGVIGYAVKNATTPASVEPVYRSTNAILAAMLFAVLGAVIGLVFGAILGGRVVKRSRREASDSRTKGQGSCLGDLAGIFGGPAAAALSSVPSLFMGYGMAQAWLPTRPPPVSELAMALPFLATLAGVVGFPCVLIAWVWPSLRRWYAWIGVAAASAVTSALIWIAIVYLVAKKPLADPSAFTILMGLTISGAIGGLVSRKIVVSRLRR